MALGTPTERATVNSGTDGTVFTISSFTPPASVFLYMFFASGHATAATEPTIGGTLGLTWTKVEGQTTTPGTIRGTLWRSATTASPPTGTITFTHGTTHSWGIGFVGSISGVDTTTPIAESGTPFQTTTTDNPGITLGSIAAGNMTMGFNAWNRTFVLPPGSGYTAVNSASGSQATPTGIVGAEYKMAGASLVDWTTTDDIAKILFAIEVAAAGVTGDATATETATVSAVGVRATTGAGTQTATATVTASGFVASTRAATQSVVATINNAAGVVARAGAAAVTASVSITASGFVASTRGSTETVTATLTADGVRAATAACSVTAAVGITSAGVRSASTTAPVTATVTISADGNVVTGSGNYTGDAAVSVTATVTSAGVKGLAGAGTQTATVTLTASGVIAKSGSASQGVTATVTATGARAAVGDAQQAVSVTLSGAGPLGRSAGSSVTVGVTIEADGYGGSPGTPVDHPALTITTTTAQATFDAEAGTMTVAILTRVLTVEASEADVTLTTAQPILELTGTS